LPSRSARAAVVILRLSRRVASVIAKTGYLVSARSKIPAHCSSVAISHSTTCIVRSRSSISVLIVESSRRAVALEIPKRRCMFIRVLQNDPNWHTLDCLPVPYAIDRKKPATMGGRRPPRFNAGRPGLLKPLRLGSDGPANVAGFVNVGPMLRCHGRGPYGRPCSQNNQTHHTKSGLGLRSRRNRTSPTSSWGAAPASPHEPSRISGTQKTLLS
jgi:hypothetical protein